MVKARKIKKVPLYKAARCRRESSQPKARKNKTKKIKQVTISPTGRYARRQSRKSSQTNTRASWFGNKIKSRSKRNSERTRT